MLHSDFEAIASERKQQLEWVTDMVKIMNGIRNETAHVNDKGQPCALRRLTPNEVRTLQSKDCSSSDWTKVLLLLDPLDASRDQSATLQDLASRTRFEGSVVFVLDRSNVDPPAITKTEKWRNLIPWGVHDCAVIANSILHLATIQVHRCSVVTDTYVKPWAVVMNCETIQCTQPHASHLAITVGPETGGGRHFVLAPESTMVNVGRQLVSCQPDRIPPTISAAQCLNVIGSYSVVRSTASLDTVYLHDNCKIEDGGCIRNALLFPSSTIRTACTVTNVVMQWNSCISQNSSVSDTLVMEQSEVGPHGVVAHTVLGPDVHVSNGEIHASILGPNCNAHHQSLLLAVLWPLGRGNVGYGANVGSNHTGRIPDQECGAGEGTFWGLSCVVKFPVDLVAAPYSIIAAGTTLAPQRCTMPFSLIVSSGAETSIIPGWVLRHSPYTLVRSEHKFATRRKAVRHASYTGWKIIRPETIQLVVHARAALVSVLEPAAVYDGDAAIAGLGKNQLAEAGRLGGIQAYTECIQRFALQGLLDFVVAAVARSKHDRLALDDILHREFNVALSAPSLERGNGTAQSLVTWPMFPWDTDQSPEAFWKMQRVLLVMEFPMSRHSSAHHSLTSTWVHTLLQRCLTLETAFAQAVYKCKQRDDVRGAATIPDYSKAHVLVDDDPVIASVRKELKEKETIIQSLLAELTAQSRL